MKYMGYLIVNTSKSRETKTEQYLTSVEFFSGGIEYKLTDDISQAQTFTNGKDYDFISRCGFGNMVRVDFGVA